MQSKTEESTNEVLVTKAEEIAESPLTADELAMIGEFDQAVREIQLQARGAMRLMIRQRGLVGNWRLENGKLVKAT
jgi:hypothetical protein